MTIATTTRGGLRQAGHNPRTRELAALTAARLTAGERLASIAEDAGVTPATLRKHLRDTGRALAADQGINDKDGGVCEDYRVLAHAMPHAEAIDWLCDVIDMQRGWDQDARWRVQEHGFTRQEAGFLLTLASSREAVAHERLAVVTRTLRPDAEAPDPKHLKVIASKVRRKFAALGWGARIVTVWTFGYRLDRPACFVFPWEAGS